jgi:N-formylglutamate deformylase
MEVAGDAAPYTAVLDGRFKGGYITRAYGRPAEGVHAVQLELAQIAYMDEDPPFTWRPDKAARLQPVLKALLQAVLDWAQVQPDSRP